MADIIYSYNGAGVTDKDTVRFKIADVGYGDFWEFSDQDIKYALTEAHDNIDRATMTMVKSLVAKYAGACDERINDVSTFNGQLYTNYKSMLDDMIRRKGRTAVPFAGGISHADKKARHKDRDNIGSWAKVNDDNTEFIY